MPYEIAVTSGFTVGPGTTPPELQLGLEYKLGTVTTYGVKFIQVDLLEATGVTHLFDTHVVKQIKNLIDSLGIRWSIHAEAGPSVAFETAMQIYWNMAHRKLNMYLDQLYELFVKTRPENNTNLFKYRPEFIDFHISNMQTIGYITDKFRFAGIATVDFFGRDDWSKLINGDKKLFEWFARNILKIILFREIPVLIETESQLVLRTLEAAKSFAPEIYFKIITQLAFGINEEFKKKDQEVKEAMKKVAPDVAKMLEKSLHDEMEKEIMRAEKIVNLVENGKISQEDIDQLLYKYWIEVSTGRFGRGVINIEEVAYTVVAKYLEVNKNNPNEPLWNLFFNGKSMEDLEKQWGGKQFVDIKKGEVYLHPDIVAMVGARYILGHFETPLEKRLPEDLTERAGRLHTTVEAMRTSDPFYFKTPFEKLDKLKIYIVFENPEISEGQLEGLQRIIHARHMYFTVKAADTHAKKMNVENHLRLLIDFEHWAHNTIEPDRELTDPRLAKDFGKYVMATHVYYPAPSHIHLPLEIGTDAHVKVYRWLFLLRKLGFDKGVLIFERGGGQHPGEYIRTSVFALRAIAEQLVKDTPPDKLPLEFFGVSPAGFFSPDRQLAIIKEHFFDPLKGTLAVPEEEHGFIGGEYLKKPGTQAEKWKKEELR